MHLLPYRSLDFTRNSELKHLPSAREAAALR